MKRVLLIIMAVMAFAGMSVAQTVYTAGEYKNQYGKDAAVVFENGEVYYEKSAPGCDFWCKDVVMDSQGNLYWVENSDNGSEQYGDVIMNHSGYLIGLGGTEVYALAVDSYDYLYSVGTKYGVDGKRGAAIWENDESEPWGLFSGLHDGHCIATDVVCDGGTVYTCGYEYWTEGGQTDYIGYVWRNNEEQPLYQLPHVRFFGIDVYEGRIYTIGAEWEAGVFVPKVFVEGSEEIAIGDSESYLPDALKVDCGDYYFTISSGTDGHTANNSIWKNNQVYIAPGDAEYINGLDVTPEGVYYTATRGDFFEGYHSAVYKDGQLLWAPDKLGYVYNMFVIPAECDGEVRTLPYFEGFEMGATDWTCWAALDSDEQNGDEASYWHRGGENTYYPAATGDYCAWHEYGGYGDQEGELISPIIALPTEGNSKLTFKSLERYPDYYQHGTEYVLVASEQYESGIEVWRATEEEVSEEWKTIEIDLSDFKGQEIIVVFVYEGYDAHDWYIDDVSITADGGGTNVISEIHIDGFTAPVYGAHPDFDLTVPSDANYTIAGAGWTDEDQDLSPEDVFEEGSYYMWVELAPKPGYSFDENATVYFNGDASLCDDFYNTIMNNGNFSTWTIDFEVTNGGGGTNVISEIHIDGFTAPVYGAHPDFDVTVPSDANYTINNVGWTDYDQYLLLEDVFEEGTYYMWVELAPKPGYSFDANATVYFNGDASLCDDDSNTIMDNGCFNTCTIDFEVTNGGGGTTYTVNAIVTPTGAGTVSGTGTYAAGSMAVLTAIPNGGYNFVKWSDGVTDNPRTLQVNEDLLLTAVFEAVQYTVSVSASPAEGGTVTGGGVFSYGQVITLTATANSGYTFVAWSDGSTEATHTVTVTGNVNYVATFSQGGTTYYTVSAIASPVGAGTLVGTGPYPAGTTVTLAAIPNTGYSFVKWSDEVTDNPRTFTLTGNVTLMAIFSGVGMDESEGKVIALYPNPASESIHITGLEANSEVQIYNNLGMLVKVVKVGADEEISISDLSNGLYMVRCGKTTMRFVKTR